LLAELVAVAVLAVFLIYWLVVALELVAAVDMEIATRT
jgi:hypothetical protein